MAVRDHSTTSACIGAEGGAGVGGRRACDALAARQPSGATSCASVLWPRSPRTCIAHEARASSRSSGGKRACAVLLPGCPKPRVLLLLLLLLLLACRSRGNKGRAPLRPRT
eukprot:3268309-Prymnesium_polylepis.1